MNGYFILVAFVLIAIGVHSFLRPKVNWGEKTAIFASCALSFIFVVFGLTTIRALPFQAQDYIYSNISDYETETPEPSRTPYKPIRDFNVQLGNDNKAIRATETESPLEKFQWMFTFSILDLAENTKNELYKRTLNKAEKFLVRNEEGSSWVMFLEEYKMTGEEYLATINGVAIASAYFSELAGGGEPYYSDIYFYFYDEYGALSYMHIAGDDAIKAIISGEKSTFSASIMDYGCEHIICSRYPARVDRYIQMKDPSQGKYSEEEYYGDDQREVEEDRGYDGSGSLSGMDTFN